MQRRPDSMSATRPSPDLERDLAAYHEAGHVIAHLHRGGRVEFTEIARDDDGGWRGRTRSDALPTWHAANKLRRTFVVALYAGRAAADLYAPDWLRWNAMCAGADGVGGDEDEAALLLEDLDEGELRAEAARLLRRRWAQVEAIADALIRVGRLNSDDVLSTLDSHAR